MPATIKTFYPKNRKAWRKWLQKYYASEESVWLIYYKKHTGISSISYNDAVEEALCFGWIDSVVNPIDQEKFKQKFTPRKIKSGWSAVNKKRLEFLISQNMMHPAGLAAIDIAKLNGSWTKLDDAENFIIPDDLAKVFAKQKKVFKYFELLSKSVKKLWLYKLTNAKLTETRTRRINELIEEANKFYMK